MSKVKSHKNRYKVKEKTELELLKGIRGSWNGINPVTKIFKDRSKYDRKQKHKKAGRDYDD